MFSMAGIPPLAGFFGKMYVLLAAVNHQLIWLAVIGVAASVVSGYYYLKVVKVMYFDEPTQPFDKDMPLMLRIGVGISVAVTLLFFLVPSGLVAQVKDVAEIMVK
jgi:NADH-quinone oxidoreductase subunit N